MYAPDKLKEVLAEGRTVRLVEDNIYSALADDASAYASRYDKRAAVYDLIVGTRLYNRLMWGASLLDYRAFARAALRSGTGRFLDAACGSFLFTARAYLATERPIIAFDQSLEMLRRARCRINQLAGSVPAHIVLLQADLADLVFRPACFETVLCMNVLHHLADASSTVARLKQLAAPGGQLYFTSLVASSRFVGDRGLDLMYRTGEFVRPRTSAELRSLLDAALGPGISYRTSGNMSYASTNVLA